MKNILTVSFTMLVLVLGNWLVSFFMPLGFLDIAIPFAGLAVVIVFFFKSRGGMASRQLDMSIQGATGIRMEQSAPVSNRSYILIGSILYLVLMVGITFFAYRDYFFN
ncbi:hypothetical protein AUC31_14495 [Planococcus rifietoensis]|uniref:DUF3899 domain-containing protein n=1 Tax=Planococcus rifietoensis TaxID=200991 RepID=A0A0U2YNY4_9BACL|nr:hypothetical protein [Planococcus rifietoensis]ALS76330.1 hypothetical protein AUC31_14495 [Planococcus rifietoensis]